MNYKLTLSLLALQIPITSYLVAIYINNPIPPKSTLEREPITITAAQRRSPHAQLTKSDGAHYFAEFPVTTGITAKEFSGISVQETRDLVGCKGVAAMTPLRGAVPARLNIWEIDCGSVSKSYEEIQEAAALSRKAARSGFNFYLFLITGLTGYFFILEEIARRRNKKLPNQDTQIINQGE